MSILPLMDALILFGWTSLVAGGLLKAVYVTTHYRPTLLGLSPIDFLGVAIVAFLLVLTLAARTWVKAAEPELLRRRRARAYPQPDASPWSNGDLRSDRIDAIDGRDGNPESEATSGLGPLPAIEPASVRARERRR